MKKTYREKQRQKELHEKRNNTDVSESERCFAILFSSSTNDSETNEDNR